jgi:uncharacterized pyridoxamine 5'-phosphate oxidase family protein
MASHNQQHADVHTFLQTHPMGILSTVDVEGNPWGAAIYFIADDDFNFYFVTRSETYKFQNLERNPHVALTVADSKSQITVQAAGVVSTMPVDKYIDIFFDKFTKLRPAGDHLWAPPIEKIQQGSYMPLVLTPERMQYADYGRQRIEVRGNYIEQIIPAL